jgi:hypothetical protein
MCFRPSRSADRASERCPAVRQEFDRGFGQPCLGEVMREQRRFGCSRVGKPIAQNLSRLVSTLWHIYSRVFAPRSTFGSAGNVEAATE